MSRDAQRSYFQLSSLPSRWEIFLWSLCFLFQNVRVSRSFWATLYLVTLMFDNFSSRPFQKLKRVPIDTSRHSASIGIVCCHPPALVLVEKWHIVSFGSSRSLSQNVRVSRTFCATLCGMTLKFDNFFSRSIQKLKWVPIDTSRHSASIGIICCHPPTLVLVEKWHKAIFPYCSADGCLGSSLFTVVRCLSSFHSLPLISLQSSYFPIFPSLFVATCSRYLLAVSLFALVAVLSCCFPGVV